MRQLPEETLVKELRRIGVEQSGHFVLNSGLHSDRKLEFDALFDHPRLLRTIVKDVATVVEYNNDDTVVAVPDGAQNIAARGWSFAYPDLVYATKRGRRAFSFSQFQAERLESAQRVAVFEDVVTTGSTPAALGRAVLRINPDVELDLIAIARRSPLQPENEALFRTCYFLAELDINAWPAPECNDCLV